MIAEGFDEGQDGETVEYAAEILQNEGEAYFLRQQDQAEEESPPSPSESWLEAELELPATQGTNAHVWHWHCEDCGLRRQGRMQQRDDTFGNMLGGALADNFNNGADTPGVKVMELAGTVVMVQKSGGVPVELEKLPPSWSDVWRFIDKRSERQRPRLAGRATSVKNVSDDTMFKSGKYRGETFLKVYTDFPEYVAWIVSQNTNLVESSLRAFYRYVMCKKGEKKAANPVAHMGATRPAGLVLDLGNLFMQDLEVEDRDGLPPVKLLPLNDGNRQHFAMMASENLPAQLDPNDTPPELDEQESEERPGDHRLRRWTVDRVHLLVAKKNTYFYRDYDHVHEENKGSPAETEVGMIAAFDEEKPITLNKGQKRQLQEVSDNVGRQDAAMWSELQGVPAYRRTSRLLPRGCRSFVMELFAGAAAITAVAMGYGMPASMPIDLHSPGWDLRDPAARQRLHSHIEAEDPYLLAIAPVTLPWNQ
ncbi:unnamed protein product [Symbiodinium sp. CCMP2592]|nr:unnamed protein product [Symbiodinium sp. CCMP2592]